MNIETVYRTSKGLFWSEAEASKKCNRRKEFGNRPGDSAEYEPVVTAWVLIDVGRIFELAAATVK